MSLTPLVYTGMIPEVIPCLSVTLEGRVNTGTERFDVELKSGLGDSDVPFHASFRFKEGIVVRNHRKKGGAWGSEEKEGAMSLSPGQDFIIQFKINSNTIEMIVNGTHFSSFNHRLPMSSISSVAVYGGASVSSIKFI